MQASGPAAVLVKSHGDFVFWVQRSASMLVQATDSRAWMWEAPKLTHCKSSEGKIDLSHFIL